MTLKEVVRAGKTAYKKGQRNKTTTVYMDIMTSFQVVSHDLIQVYG